MTSRRMQQAIVRLMNDQRFAERFRQDPERALARYHLSPAQVTAIKAGDADSLAAHGVDVGVLTARSRRRNRRVGRRVFTGLAVIAGTLGFSAPPASAIRVTLTRRLDGIWNLGHASERSGVDLHDNVDNVEVPTEGVPGRGRPFVLHQE